MRSSTACPCPIWTAHQTGATLSHFTNDMDKMSEAMQYGILRLVTSVVLLWAPVVDDVPGSTWS